MKSKIQTNRQGFSLIEVLISILVLVVLAVGGATLLSYTGAGILKHGNRRVALELANLRQEVIRSQDYYSISGDFGEANRVYLTDTDDDGILELNDNPVSEQIDIGDGVIYTMLTELIRWKFDDPDNPAPYIEPEHLEVVVIVDYRSSDSETIELKQTLIPPEVTQN